MNNYKVLENINQDEKGFVNSKGEKSLLFELIARLINEIVFNKMKSLHERKKICKFSNKKV